MSEERPLPNREAVLTRRESVQESLKVTLLELRLTSWWRWRKRATLKVEISYLEGLNEGLRLGLKPPLRPNPSR